MHLSDYVERFPERKPAEWGRLFQISRTHFLHLCAGNRNPSMAVMKRIEDKTAGAVPVTSWFKGRPETDVVDEPADHVEP